MLSSLKNNRTLVRFFTNGQGVLAVIRIFSITGQIGIKGKPLILLNLLGCTILSQITSWIAIGFFN